MEWELIKRDSYNRWKPPHPNWLNAPMLSRQKHGLRLNKLGCEQMGLEEQNRMVCFFQRGEEWALKVAETDEEQLMGSLARPATHSGDVPDGVRLCNSMINKRINVGIYYLKPSGKVFRLEAV